MNAQAEPQEGGGPALVEVACGIGVYPLKTSTRGPAPLGKAGTLRRRPLPASSLPLHTPSIIAHHAPAAAASATPPRPPHGFPSSAPADEADIIDEVIGFFKANTLFKQFQPQGAGDRLLIYLTLYITECLKIIEKCATPVDAMKQLTSKAHESFKIPGDAGFALGSFYPGPTTSQEADLCRGYLKQAREEIGRRLIEKVYVDGAPSKFWTTFAKRKFMNKAL